MFCEVQLSDECDRWFKGLDMKVQVRVLARLNLLEAKGVALGDPYSSDIRGSKHSGMRELRIQVGGNPYRVLYIFDPRRVALLLVGGNKTGNEAWYKTQIPVADRIYDEHLMALTGGSSSSKKGESDG